MNKTKLVYLSLPEEIWRALDSWAAVITQKRHELGYKGRVRHGQLIAAFVALTILDNREELHQRHQELVLQFSGLVDAMGAEAARAAIASVLPDFQGDVRSRRGASDHPQRDVRRAAWGSAGALAAGHGEESGEVPTGSYRPRKRPAGEQPSADGRREKAARPGRRRSRRKKRKTSARKKAHPPAASSKKAAV